MGTALIQPGLEQARPTPKAFVSYGWESDEHRDWVRDLAARLRGDGVDVTLDKWELQPGDQLPAFMERAVRENDYVLIVCTPHYKRRSNERMGGVGYEGDIMTAEALMTRNERKFIPLFRSGNDWRDAAPTWLQGKYYIDFRGNPYLEERYQDLITTLHGTRPAAPRIGYPSRLNRLPVAPGVPSSQTPQPPPEFVPIQILGVVVDEITQPRADGTRGSALYTVPFQLSRRPSSEWAQVFVEKWNHPSSWTSMHRPGIASLTGDKVYLNGTTVEEVQKYHRDTLKLALEETNTLIADYLRRKHAEAERERAKREQHSQSVRDAAKNIRF
jgi:hypothetical protein